MQIEFLASNGVQEVYIFCAWHAAQIEEYVNSTAWSRRIILHVISASTTCLTAGDALRELDNMAVIRSDPFVLINGDVISNMNLSAAISDHKERRQKDSSVIMTVVFGEANTTHPTRPLVDDLVVAIDKASGQIVQFDDQRSNDKIVMPIEFFKEHAEIQFRYDLLDTHVDICSPEVLMQFSDNFDYQDIRKDFIHNEAANFELGNKILAHVIQVLSNSLCNLYLAMPYHEHCFSGRICCPRP
jgi:translation initiation factor eIF-2B subunit epsilon